MSQVKANDTVKVHYTGSITANGEIFDSSLEREPLEFTLGQGMLIPGFENGVLNMKVNEKKTINIPKEEAYGVVREELFQEVSKQELPPDLEPQVGMGLVSRGPNGQEHQLRVAQVNDKSIVVDANHPLAGHDLTFELEVVEIK
ncbi:peptidylprolyl isomerase [Paucihalobacter ruber]|uniref:Peptidyl-prolyl cis-trans isomerase n=1 Tax=Paucihalobacter ruber TaxID=2567861 RepID=A0A506PFZ0_9FLAO|nr:peptidylprolyl isomerase [Paucihalobacter ruber]TPV32494.1 peptidylprolyl isomerase [Paucihalobacter ruber]